MKEKKEFKTCVKCGESYLGDACVGCHSNQYAHYNNDMTTKSKVFIGLAIVVIIVLIVLQS